MPGGAPEQRARLKAADAALFAKDYREAIRLATLVIEANVSSHIVMGHAYATRAYARLDSGDRAGAQADGQRSAELAPDMPNGHSALGLVALSERRWADAEVHFSRLAEVEPDHWVGPYYRGLARLAQRNIDGAFADFDRATLLEPKLDGAWARRGLIHELRGQRDDAVADYRRALRLRPDNAIARRGIARLAAARPPPPRLDEFRRDEFRRDDRDDGAPVVRY